MQPFGLCSEGGVLTVQSPYGRPVLRSSSLDGNAEHRDVIQDFPLSSLLLNNVLDSVPLQLCMAVSALKNNTLVLLPEVRESYSGGIIKGIKCVTVISYPSFPTWDLDFSANISYRFAYHLEKLEIIFLRETL